MKPYLSSLIPHSPFVNHRSSILYQGKICKYFSILTYHSFLAIIVFLALGLNRVAYGESWGRAASKSGFVNPALLVAPEELRGHLDDSDLRIVDLRPMDKYRHGHIKGAIHIDWLALDDLAANRIGLPLSLEKAEALFGDAGIDQDTHVVAYDGSGGLYAARLFYVLEFLGHNKVHLLNGGIQGWKESGGRLITEPSSVPKKRFVAKPDPSRIATAGQIIKDLDSRDLVILDVRSPQEYQGLDVRSARGGHIPFAVNQEWKKSLEGSDKKAFRSAEELKRMFEESGITREKEVIVYCQTGVRAAHTYFTLRLLGYPWVKNYDGGWEEWGNALDLPAGKPGLCRG